MFRAILPTTLELIYDWFSLSVSPTSSKMSATYSPEGALGSKVVTSRPSWRKLSKFAVNNPPTSQTPANIRNASVLVCLSVKLKKMALLKSPLPRFTSSCNTTLNESNTVGSSWAEQLFSIIAAKFNGPSARPVWPKPRQFDRSVWILLTATVGGGDWVCYFLEVNWWMAKTNCSCPVLLWLLRNILNSQPPAIISYLFMYEKQGKKKDFFERNKKQKTDSLCSGQGTL